MGQNSTFLELCQVVYQIKENHKCSNMVENILATDTPDPGDETIGQNSTFLKHGLVAYQFKGNQK